MEPTEGTPVYRALRERIESFALLPGESLSERGLEPVLGASRTPIRAALVRLQNDGLTRQGARGWAVAPIDISEVRQALEYREAVEAAGVRLACERADPDALERARTALESGGDSDPAAQVRAGAEFHTALVAAGGNTFLTEGVSRSLTLLTRVRRLEVRTEASRTQARAEHADLLEAVVRRDAGLAVERAVAHVRGTRDRLVEFLTAQRRPLRGSGMAIVESGLSAEAAAGA